MERCSTTSPPTVLIVEDEPPLVGLLCEMLEDEGIPAEACPIGQQAFPCIVQNHPQLVILDVQMPEVDGIQLFEMMRNHPATRETPVIFFTANCQILYKRIPDYEHRGARLLPKPFEIDRFLASVHAVLGN